MIFNQCNLEKRNNILICSASIEGFDTSVNLGCNDAIKIMNLKYNESILDSPPYHFIVSDNDIIELKSLNLAHNDNSSLSAYNNDVKILLLKDSALSNNTDNIIQLITDISLKYSMVLKNRVLLLGNNDVLNNKIIDNIIKLSIVKRNKINPILSICETVINNEIIINENVVMINNRRGYNKLSLLANKYIIPLSILINLNPHVNQDQLKVTDTLFIPRTTSIAGDITAQDIEKISIAIHENCKYITGGILNNG